MPKNHSCVVREYSRRDPSAVADVLVMKARRHPYSEGLLFINESCPAEKKRARSYLAHRGIRSRIRRQAEHKLNSIHHRSAAPRIDIDAVSGEPDRCITPGAALPGQIRLSGFSLVEQLVSTSVYAGMASTWGVSPAICPGPTHLTHRLSHCTPALAAIFRANVAFHCIDLHIWTTTEERRNLQLTALTYRGEAIGSARQELVGFLNRYSDVAHGGRVTLESPNWELSFTIVLRLLQLDYRFARDGVDSHFVACRRLLRSRLPGFRASEDSLRELATTIRNPHLHHITITFECAHSTPESVIWDTGDLEFFRLSLSSLLRRISSAPGAVSAGDTGGSRIPRDTLLWRCLSKKPGRVASNIYGDVSEALVQLGSILVLCSVFLDYDAGAGSSIPQLCIQSLETSLLALGEREALGSALNVSWLLGGGEGLPPSNPRERLWLASGVLYALRVSPRLDMEEEGILGRDEIKAIGLNFLGRPD